MNYECINMGAYNLHIINTKKFKTITMEVDFRRKICKQDITKRNLLKSLLLYSTKEYPEERELIKQTENLYDLKLISSNTRVGNYSNLGFKIRFLNEKYTESGMNKESISFLMDVLFNPDIKDNAFKSDNLDKCKNKLEKSLKSIKDNKLKYTLFKLLETTEDMPYSYNPYGYIEDLEKINGENLYKYYKEILDEDLIDIFVVGDVDTTEIKEILREYFKARTFKKASTDILVDELSVVKPKKYEETIDANQTQLTILCNLKGITDFERKYVLLVYSELLGGSSNSLLFDTVREKNSYAYYVNSNMKSYDNIMMIYAGIESKNVDDVFKLIKKVLNNVIKGKFTDSDLENAKETIIASINASKDSQSGIINTYFAKVLVGSKDFDERIENIKKVTKEDIMNVAKKVYIHTEYILKGDSDEENSDE